MELTIRIITFAIIILFFIYNLWLSTLNYKNRNAIIPEEVSDVYNPEDYKKWHKYNMTNFKFGLIINAINTFVFLLLLAIGYFPFIDRVANKITSNQELSIVFFMGLYFIVNFIIGIFTSYYDTFVIEEKFGFNKTSKATFFKDKIKSLLLTIILGGSLIFGLANLYKHVSSMFFLYAYLFLAVIILLSNILYVKVFVPIFNKLKPLEDSSLKTKIEEFAKTVGYEINKISVIDASKRSSKLNAYFTGFGKFKQVVLYDTLIEKCSEEEIVAILAHEIGHNKYKHITYGLIQSLLIVLVCVGLLVLLLEFAVFSTAFKFSEANFGFAIILFLVFIEPIMIPIGLITAYLSRKHEYQADNFAATKYDKLSMETALKVLTRENFSNLTPHPLYVKLTYSHPPAADRIRAIRK